MRTTPKAKKGGAFAFYGGVPALRSIQKRGEWPDGQKLGQGYPQPCLQDKYAAAIIEGRKTFEGRPGGGWLMHRGRMITAGDYVNFQLPRRRRLVVRVLSVQHFGTFEDMLREVGIHRLLPDTELSIPHAAELYRSFANRRGTYRELESRHGVVALQIEPLVRHAMSASLSPLSSIY